VALILAVGVVYFGSIGAFPAYAVSPIGSLSLAQSYALVISTIVALGDAGGLARVPETSSRLEGPICG
jgi:hypothetical protein